MEIIRKISEQIDEELHDAEKYIKCAHKMKESYPLLADAYYKLSLEEMGHVTVLHEQVVKIVNEYKKDHEVPAGMQVLYDYLHERQIKWASKIKSKQDSYK